jgi:hypothetical protein
VALFRGFRRLAEGHDITFLGDDINAKQSRRQYMRCLKTGESNGAFDTVVNRSRDRPRYRPPNSPVRPEIRGPASADGLLGRFGPLGTKRLIAVKSALIIAGAGGRSPFAPAIKSRFPDLDALRRKFYSAVMSGHHRPVTNHAKVEPADQIRTEQLGGGDGGHRLSQRTDV